MLILLPHRNRFEIDGVRHDFEGPQFLPKLNSPEGGLYMAVADDRHPEERVFLHMPLAYAMKIMDGWIRPGDVAAAEASIMAFAMQNLRAMQLFVLKVTAEQLVTEHGHVKAFGGDKVRVLCLKQPGDLARLEDYSN